ncbi:acyloxyacyl hydrolase [Phenylobacterium sp.]|uniref:acyloxyacyl hydrolase n=1 Tax=Phenylobacterium sp. TaxID=1871053 RepID=UPI00374D2459
MRHLLCATLALAAATTAGPALAGEAFVGLYEHDIRDHIAIGGVESGQQVVFGVRTAALDELSLIWKPHVHLLAGVNTAGHTDYLAAGFDWRFTFGDGRFYVEPGIGAGIHTGAVNLPSPYAAGISSAEAARRLRDWNTKLDLGSRVLFEPELSVGWKATPRLSVEVSWIHLSHAQLAGRQNPGLSDIGVRAVYRYGEDR